MDTTSDRPSMLVENPSTEQVLLEPRDRHAFRVGAALLGVILVAGLSELAWPDGHTLVVLRTALLLVAGGVGAWMLGRKIARLRELGDRYSRVLETIEEGHWEWNLVSNEAFLSARVKEILGFAPDAQFPSPAELFLRQTVHPDDRERVADGYKTVLSGANPFYEMEYRVLPRSGEVRWVRARARVLSDERGAPALLSGSLSDITHHRLANEALREEEARSRRLTDLSSDWYWRQDENLRFTHSWSEVQEQIGFANDAWLGKTRWELPGIKLLSGTWREHQAVLEARQPFRDFEYSRIGPDGVARYMSVSGAPIFDAQGQFKGYEGIGRNITERKKVEEELRESEARFRGLIELSSDWYWEQDEDLRFTYVPHTMQMLAGYPARPEAYLGKTRWELGEKAFPVSSSWTEHQAVLAARQPFRDFEYSRVDPDGITRYASVSGAPIFDEEGRFKGYRGVGSNITERKRVEKDLRARQEILDVAQKAARAIAFEWRIGAGEGQNLRSPDLEAMYGLAAGSYDGTYDSWRRIVFPDDLRAVDGVMEHATETGDVDAEYRVMHPDSSLRWLQAKGRMIFDTERRPVRVVGFMFDVTERHQADEERRQLERQLRQAQRLEAMGTLAGGIAHDFNNILGAILGYGEMALRDVAQGSRLRRDLDSIMTAGERGRALVERILAFSRSGVGERVAVHVEKVVGEALDLLAAKLPRGVNIKRQLRAGRAAVLGDPTQVHQVLMNLATNAVQAMPAGGTLRVSLERMRVDAARVAMVGSLDMADYLVVEVADTGVGIPPDTLSRIFDPFFTTKEVGVGTGLGLSLVHGIVTELKGAIEVASNVAVGTVFTVYLPYGGDAEGDREREELDAPRGNRQQVLIVDDEAPLVRLARETLEELGYLPVAFTSSVAALEAFRAEPERFDAVITDERMPGMSGSALIREIRGIRRAIPILLVSGYVGGDVVRRALESGADEVLKKPLSARQLATSLARILSV